MFHRGPYADIDSSLAAHVVLLDLRLPKISGLEVLQKIRKRHAARNLPVVVLTTSSAEPDVAKAYEYHANSYLVKPLDFEGFSARLKDFGFYWLGLNHYPWS
jgi:DNA-binding response OmpR family regulator